MILRTALAYSLLPLFGYVIWCLLTNEDRPDHLTEDAPPHEAARGDAR